MISATMTETKQPPGPTGLPLLGSLFEAHRDPLGFEMKLVHDYGDVVHYRVGIYTGYLVTHPDGVRRVLEQNHGNYSKRNYNYEMLKPVLGEGLITSDGAQWQRHRQLMHSVFRRTHIAQFGRTMLEATAELLQRWNDIARKARPVDIFDEMMRLTLRVVADVLFSTDIRPRVDLIARAFSTLNAHVANRFRTVFVPPLWVPTPNNYAFKVARAELNEVVYEMISERRNRDRHEDDMLGLLLAACDQASDEGLTDQEVRDEVMTLLLAGHETTAALLTWTWYLIATHPDAERKLRHELVTVLGDRPPTVDDLSDLPYLERIVQESLRLYPPVWIISRKAVEQDELCGYSVPAGSIVTLSSYATHRRSDLWVNPTVFDPGRFKDERAEARPRYAYFPFGGGPRRCIGYHLAMVEARLIIATIAQQFRLELVSGQSVEPEPLVTLRPRNGLRMTVHPTQ